MKFSTLLRSTAVSMQHEFDKLTAEIGSPGSKGAAREELFRRFLSGYLPHRFQVEAGEATDCFGNTSGQIDALIMDLADTPVLYSAPGAKVFLCESVRGAIEVKSRLTTRGLLDDARKIRKLKRLSRQLNLPVFTAVESELEIGGPCPPIIGGIFAYSSPQSLSTLGRELSHWNSHVDPLERVDFMAVLESGMVFFGGDDADLFHANAHEGLQTMVWPMRPPEILLFVCLYVFDRLSGFRLYYGDVPAPNLKAYFSVAQQDLLMQP